MSVLSIITTAASGATAASGSKIFLLCKSRNRVYDRETRIVFNEKTAVAAAAAAAWVSLIQSGTRAINYICTYLH